MEKFLLLTEVFCRQQKRFGNMNSLVKSLGVLILLQDRFYNDNFEINISLELSGLVVGVNMLNRNVVDIIDSTFGNYQDLYSTSPLFRFSKSNLRFKSFLYAENINKIFTKDEEINFNKVYLDLYFKKNIKYVFNNWVNCYFYKEKIIFCDNYFFENKVIFQIIINESFSFLMEGDNIFGFCIDIDKYFNGWNDYERNFLIDYFLIINQCDWNSRDDELNVELLKKLLLSYNGFIFNKFIDGLLIEIDYM